MTARPAILVFAALALLGSACVSGPGARPTPSGAREPLVGDPTAPPWDIRDAGRRRTQRVRIAAELVSRIDSATRRDSLESELVLAWGEVPGAQPARLAGMVTAFRVRVPPAADWQVPAGLSLPFSFAAEHVPGAMPRLRTPEGASCRELSAQAIQGWREAWLPLPAALRPGQSWRDSSQYTVCRDGIPLAVDVVREFVVEGAVERGGELLVVVQRRTRTLLRGEGLQFGEPLLLRGEGEGEMRLELSRDGGQIVGGEGRSVLHVRLEGRRRQQQLLQTSRITIDQPR